MTRNISNPLVEWDPELTAEDEAYVEELRQKTTPEIALFRRVRLALGLSQVEVAQMLGMTQSAVSKMEAKGDPALSVLSRMAAARGRTLSLTFNADEGEDLKFALV